MANSSLSLGTGKGDALCTAFSAERSKISSPLLKITSADITVPSDVNLTFIVHLRPSLPVAGIIQLWITFVLMAFIVCANSEACAANLFFAASAASISALACLAASAFARASASVFALA